MYNQGYGNFYPYANYYAAAAKPGLFQSLKGFAGKTNWSNILNGTGKTLNMINQVIPIVYQVRPIWNNAKTMFRIAGALKEDNKETTSVESNSSTTNYSTKKREATSTSTSSNENIYESKTFSNEGAPTFFL